MANPNPKPPKKRGRRFCNNNRKGRRDDRKTSGTFRIFRDESTAIDQPPPAAAAAVPEAVDEPTAPSKRKLTKADLTNSLAYSRRDLKRLRRENTKLVAKCHKQNEQLEKAKVIVNKKRSQLNDGLKAKDARCKQKIESMRIRNQQMLDTKDEQCTEQLKRVEKRCAKKLEKKEEQFELKISTMKKRSSMQQQTSCWRKQVLKLAGPSQQSILTRVLLRN